MSDPRLQSTEGYGTRSTCFRRGRRRMCKTIGFWGIPGILWMLCREHGDWTPVEGVDYEVAA